MISWSQPLHFIGFPTLIYTYMSFKGHFMSIGFLYAFLPFIKLRALQREINDLSL